MPENQLANAAITDMQMRQRDVAALDAKYTKELADAKAENDACVTMLPCWSSSQYQSSLAVSQCVKLPAASGADNAASPTGRHRWILFHLRERLITMQKTTEGTQKYINEQCR